MPNGANESRRPQVYASHLCHVLGDPVPIDDTTDPEVRAELANLHEQGIRHYLVDERSVPELAVAAARPVVEKLSGRPVDMLVYCTDTPTSDPVARQMWQVQSELGLADTPAVLISSGGCGNLGAGLKVARAVMASEGLGTVLFVTADRVAGNIPRFLTHGTTVLSDSAAACLLTTEPVAEGFRVLGLSTEVKADLGVGSSQLVLGRAIMRKIGRALSAVSTESGVPPAECRHFLTSNFGRTSRAFLATAARCTPEQAYTPWVAELGHCFSADLLISLSTLLERGGLDPADRLLLLSSTPQSWSLIVAEHVAG